MVDGAAAPTRSPRGGPDGIVLLDKPVGLSSNAALQRVKRLFGAAKAGHTGSLDPLASGMLPICLGQATRFSGYLLDAPKGYQVEGLLGARTATGDAEGEVVESCAWEHVSRAMLAAALGRFRGRSRQVPPMYSALKQGGEALYRKARRGEVVERPPREIEVSRLELEDWRPPGFRLEVRCSKGTYIRTLVEDIARAAGSCAHVTMLRRYVVGPYEGSAMHSLEALQAFALQGPDVLAATVLPADSALAGLPVVALGPDEARRLRQGQVVETGRGAVGLARVYGPAGLIGVAARDAEGRLSAKRLLGTSDDS